MRKVKEGMKMRGLRVGWLPAGVAVFLLMLMGACGGGDGMETGSPTSTGPSEPARKATVLIGEITDMTGPGANAMASVDMGVTDAIRYYNENTLIPGIEVKLLQYDGQNDTAKNIPGYEWLKERGADVVMVWSAFQGTLLRPRADEDRIPLFCTVALRDVLYPPGYLFATSTVDMDMGWNMIKWIAENDWDWRTKGPARIGGACWVSDDFTGFWKGIQAYAARHPEQVEWVGGFMTPTSSFTWSREVEALKGCDYVEVPHVFANFVREYTRAGYKTRFFGTDAHAAFFKLAQDAGLWDELDGSFFIMSSEWWGEEGEIPAFIMALLEKYRSDHIQAITGSDKGYYAVLNTLTVLEIIRGAAEAVGPENVASQALYEAAQSFSLNFDGIQRFSFTETKRASPDRLAVYAVDGARGGLVRISDWMPVEAAP